MKRFLRGALMAGWIIAFSAGARAQLVADIDGNNYPTTVINGHEWMAQNLNVAKFKNGDPIPQAKTKADWALACKNKRPAWCFYNNDPTMAGKFGKLYNWYAVNDPRGLAPEGWRISNTKDVELLKSILINGKMTTADLKTSQDWNPAGTNALNFSARSGGKRVTGPSKINFYEKGTSGYWWTTEESQPGVSSIGWAMYALESMIMNINATQLTTGLSVRCVKN
jgi:uncharacterized protein (TIGR02145 family)